MTTLVSVGNATQPFRRLLDIALECLPVLPQPVLIQCGHTPCPDTTVEVARFLSNDEFKLRLMQADLLLIHAGAGSILTAVANGRKPVVCPRRSLLGEHVDDHQTELAEECARLGLVYVVHDAGQLRALLADGASFVVDRPAGGNMVPLLRDAINEVAGQAR